MANVAQANMALKFNAQAVPQVTLKITTNAGDASAWYFWLKEQESVKGKSDVHCAQNGKEITQLEGIEYLNRWGPDSDNSQAVRNRTEVAAAIAAKALEAPQTDTSGAPLIACIADALHQMHTNMITKQPCMPDKPRQTWADNMSDYLRGANTSVLQETVTDETVLMAKYQGGVCPECKVELIGPRSAGSAVTRFFGPQGFTYTNHFL